MQMITALGMQVHPSALVSTFSSRLHEVHAKSHNEPIAFCGDFIIMYLLYSINSAANQIRAEVVNFAWDSVTSFRGPHATHCGLTLRRDSPQSPSNPIPNLSVGLMMHPTISFPTVPSFDLRLRNIGNHLHSISACPVAEYPTEI